MTTDYGITAEQKANLENVFTYHAPITDQTERYALLRSAAKVLAVLIQRTCPKSREASLAMTHLEQSVMWANAGIARNEKIDDNKAKESK